jgi:adenylate kinase family enzyme
MQKRILIFGNSGAGKSTLAKAIAREAGLAHLDLDTLAWEPVMPPQRKSLAESARQIKDFTTANDNWVIEGCYADLLELLAEAADKIIFMNLPVELCQANARARPWEPHKYPSKEAQDANLSMLLDWIADYPRRDDVFSQHAHQRFYDNFKGEKELILDNKNNKQGE